MECCILLDKTQHQIENEYAYIDLPQLLLLKNQRRATELLEQLEIVNFPYNTDTRSRKKLVDKLYSQLPQPEQAPAKPVEDQYEAQLARMKGG